MSRSSAFKKLMKEHETSKPSLEDLDKKFEKLQNSKRPIFKAVPAAYRNYGKKALNAPTTLPESKDCKEFMDENFERIKNLTPGISQIAALRERSTCYSSVKKYTDIDGYDE